MAKMQGMTAGQRLPSDATTRSGAPPSATIDDVAQRAGVHRGTVSRALRGIAGKVSPAKRAEIERIAAELGYRPNLLAASLRTKHSDMAAVLVPDLGNPLFAPIVQGLESALRREGLVCLVVQPPADAQERRTLVRSLAARQVAGLLVLAAESDDPMLAEASSLHLPTVLLNRGLGERRFPCVVNDDRESVQLVLEHLTGLGHRRIGHLAGPQTSSTGRARCQAFVEQARALGLAHAPVFEGDGFTRAAGEATAREVLAAPGPRPTALFAANDLMALGALQVLHAAGLQVPQDVSLVGHNDMPLVDLVSPPLTTVRVAVDEMSRQAAQLFCERLAQSTLPPSTRLLLPTLVVRGSTAAAPTTA
jgi:LacI family transcriptional regulator